MRQADGPRGECVPGAGAADGNRNLQDDRQEQRAPDRGAMDSVHRPQVVADYEQQKKPDEDALKVRPGGDCGERRPARGRSHEGDRGDENQAFVRSGIEASAEGEENQGRKSQNGAERNRVKRLRIEPRARRRNSSGERIRGGQQPENNHEASQAEACKPELPVNVDAPGDDQRGLRDQQKNPAREHGSVHVDDRWRAEARGTRQRESRFVQNRQTQCARRRSAMPEKKQSSERPPARIPVVLRGNVAVATAPPSDRLRSTCLIGPEKFD